MEPVLNEHFKIMLINGACPPCIQERVGFLFIPGDNRVDQGLSQILLFFHTGFKLGEIGPFCTHLVSDFKILNFALQINVLSKGFNYRYFEPALMIY